MERLLPEVCKIQYGYAFDSTKFTTTITFLQKDCFFYNVEILNRIYYVVYQYNRGVVELVESVEVGISVKNDRCIGKSVIYCIFLHKLNSYESILYLCQVKAIPR